MVGSGRVTVTVGLQLPNPTQCPVWKLGPPVCASVRVASPAGAWCFSNGWESSTLPNVAGLNVTESERVRPAFPSKMAEDFSIVLLSREMGLEYGRAVGDGCPSEPIGSEPSVV